MHFPFSFLYFNVCLFVFRLEEEEEYLPVISSVRSCLERVRSGGSQG